MSIKSQTANLGPDKYGVSYPVNARGQYFKYRVMDWKEWPECIGYVNTLYEARKLVKQRIKDTDADCDCSIDKYSKTEDLYLLYE